MNSKISRSRVFQDLKEILRQAETLDDLGERLANYVSKIQWDYDDEFLPVVPGRSPVPEREA